ncbi:hypothetical protein [Clostridium aminobutyricum]|uniref:Uncharacterized protein n=1 Tax=Clostridium aminobutyricum TaxID=33953 RepID=A0A939D7U3_CLOAM|nr:hypothetical protein [Clostridium aminobutyricum]MBN7773029.1 hypothetical protein [Clostridium aminobutyricum]
MGLLEQLKDEYKILSIVGMAKNAGKTTVLNYLIEEAMDEGIVLGITSTGRDGESVDLVTGTAKPKIFLDAGTIVSIPKQLYEFADAGLEILRISRYSTAMGPILLCRVVQSGNVQIAGPVSTADHKEMCKEMLALGAEKILIDGAIDRKSIAAPETSDAIILATGAVLSRSLHKIVEETVYTIELYTLPVLENQFIQQVIEAQENRNRVVVFSDDNFELLDLKTGLGASKLIDEAISEKITHVYIPGAMTGSVIADIHPKKFKRVKFVLKDPTKIFMDYFTWGRLKKQGFCVEVIQNINIAAVTVNPVSPFGYCFEHRVLIDAMTAAIKNIPVIDVKYRFD